MIHHIFSVYDEKAQAFLPPFFLPQTAMAVRVFTDCINSDDHQFSKHPADYTLFLLGNWDDAEGAIHLREGKKSLGNGVEFRKPTAEQYTNGEVLGSETVSDDPPVFASSTGDNSS